MRILLVEDNRQLSVWLQRTLERGGYTVDCAYDGVSADHMLYAAAYALVILDLALPKLDGREVLRRLRGRRDNVPVLILTASATAADRVSGLDTGADDYVAKPFDAAELEARVRALIRRSSGVASPRIDCGRLGYDANTRQFVVDGRVVAFTPRERTLLETLMLNVGKTVAKTALADSLVHIDEDVTPDAVEVYIHRVRRKIEGADAAIITLRGIGYMLRASSEA